MVSEVLVIVLPANSIDGAQGLLHVQYHTINVIGLS